VAPGTTTFGGARNRVSLVSKSGVEDWPELEKNEVARELIIHFAEMLS
jgi:phosphopantothenoylcysteine decarboxylase/phosphopantothenate--cysteine ligase